MTNDTNSEHGYQFEYKLEQPYKNENIYSNDFHRKYSQGHYIHLVQSERTRSTYASSEKTPYIKNESKLNTFL